MNEWYLQCIYIPAKLRTVLAVACEWRFCRYSLRRRPMCLSTLDSLPEELSPYNHLMYAETPPLPVVRRCDGRFSIPNICTRLRLNARRNCTRVLLGTSCVTSSWRLGAFSAETKMPPPKLTVVTISDASRTNKTFLSSMSSTTARNYWCVEITASWGRIIKINQYGNLSQVRQNFRSRWALSRRLRAVATLSK